MDATVCLIRGVVIWHGCEWRASRDLRPMVLHRGVRKPRRAPKAGADDDRSANGRSPRDREVR
jgi:hypothetical protein